MEMQKGGSYEDDYLIPREYRDRLDYHGIGNVGPLIIQGNICHSYNRYHEDRWHQATKFTIFGTNKDQNEVY